MSKQIFWRLMRQPQHHARSVYPLRCYLILPHPIKMRILLDKFTNQMKKKITLISQMHFDFLICGKLNGNMTDTSQGRNKTTVHHREYHMHQWIQFLNKVEAYDHGSKLTNDKTKPVQPANTLLLSYSTQSRKCTSIWHHTCFHSLSLLKDKGKNEIAQSFNSFIG